MCQNDATHKVWYTEGGSALVCLDCSGHAHPTHGPVLRSRERYHNWTREMAKKRCECAACMKGIGMATRTLRIVLAVSVYDTQAAGGDDSAMINRVLNAIVPHPDSVIATDSGHNERCTVLVTDTEVTS